MWGGDTVKCVNNELVIDFVGNLGRMHVIRISPKQIYNYKVIRDLSSKVPFFRRWKRIRVEYRDKNGKSWFEFRTIEPQLLERYLKENVKKPKQP